jgi:hypothetical protein
MSAQIFGPLAFLVILAAGIWLGFALEREEGRAEEARSRLYVIDGDGDDLTPPGPSHPATRALEGRRHG